MRRENDDLGFAGLDLLHQAPDEVLVFGGVNVSGELGQRACEEPAAWRAHAAVRPCAISSMKMRDSSAL